MGESKQQRRDDATWFPDKAIGVWGPADCTCSRYNDCYIKQFS